MSTTSKKDNMVFVFVDNLLVKYGLHLGGPLKMFKIFAESINAKNQEL